MAIKDLFFGIFAQDKTGGAFDSVGKRLRQTEGAVDSLGSKFRRAGNSALKFGAVASAASAGVIAAFRDSLSLFDVQERAQAKVEQAILSTGRAAGFTADELFKTASALQGITRFGDESILDGVTAQLLTFTNIAGEEFQRAQVAALDLATVLNGDLKSTAVQLGKALNDPVRGLSALGDAGIQFSEDQREAIKAMVEMGNIAGAQQAILGELERQYGGQAEAAARVGTGALAQLSNAWGDLKEQVGGVLSELLPPVTDFLRRIVDGFSALPEPVKRFTIILGAVAVVAGPVIVAVGALTLAIGAIGAPVLAAGAAIAALTAAVVAFWPEVEKMAKSVEENITRMVEKVTVLFEEKLAAATDFVIAKVGEVKAAFFDLWDAVVGNSYVPDMVDGIEAEFGRLPGAMVAPAEAATSATGGLFSGMADDVLDRIGRMRTEGLSAWDGFGRSLLDRANSMVDKVIDQAFGRLVNAAAESFNLFGSASAGPRGFTAKGGGGIGGFLSSAASGLGNLLGFHDGGEFTVRGRAGLDRNVVPIKAEPGERVRVDRPGEGGGRVPVTVNIYAQDVESFRRSTGQVASAISRAVGRAERYA